MKLTTAFFTAVCSIIFTIQLVFYIRDTVNSTELYTEMSREQLSDQPLPLRISLCLKPGLNKTELSNAGYLDETNYSYGQSIYNRSLFGWNGHTKEGRNMPTNISDFNEKLSIWKKLSDIVQMFIILKESSIESLTGKKEINSLVESARVFYAEYCFTLKPNTLSNAESVTIVMQPNLMFQEIQIKLSDINLYSGRHIVAHSLNHRGDQISTKALQQNILKIFYVELSQEVYVKDDPTKNCTNYPNSEHMTYNDCDRWSALSTMKNKISPNFYPYWAAPSNDFSNVTKDPVFIDTSTNMGGYLTHVNYATGLKTSQCRIPCNVTKTVTKFITDQEFFLGAGVSVSFNQDMQVTRTSLVQFSPIKCLCDMGGMLGLWLGLGALQLAELLIKTARMTWRKLALAKTSN